ncbi:hypothetical protein [Carnobacterium sp. FSL E2-0243]|uniref:hypothetical protein n=1 Tax=Carnobacterium sp. FSL E2-0243 TaxID=2921365 RepID=UPI0030FCF155
MKFEEKWLDVEIINIEFLSFEKKRHNRVFIIPVGLTKKEIVTFLQKEFYLVEEYLHIDFIEEGFYYKGNYFSTINQEKKMI